MGSLLVILIFTVSLQVGVRRAPLRQHRKILRTQEAYVGLILHRKQYVHRSFVGSPSLRELHLSHLDRRIEHLSVFLKSLTEQYQAHYGDPYKRWLLRLPVPPELPQ